MTLPVVGYEGLYEISSDGYIKSLTRYKNILRPWVNKSTGYPMVTLYGRGKSKKSSVHRLMAIHFIPNPSNLPQVNHKDNDRSNFSLHNLEWATDSENQRHSYLTNGRIVWNKGKKTGIVTKGCFQKGMEPWNKGKKLPYPVASAFRPGNTPWNKGLELNEKVGKGGV